MGSHRPVAPAAGGLGLTFAAVLLWGAQLPIAKSALADIDGYSMTVVRYGVAAMALALLLRGLEGREALSFGGQPIRAVVCGVIGMAGSALLVFIGLALTQPEIAVILISLQPAMTAIAHWMVRGRRPDGFTLTSIGVAFSGVLLVVGRGGGMPASPLEWLGDAMVLAGAAAWVAYTMLAEGFRGWSALRLSTLTSLTAMPPILIIWGVAAALGGAPLTSWQAMPDHLPALAYVSLIGVVAGMLLWNAGTRRAGPLNAVLILNLMPVITFGIQAARGAQFAPLQLVGAGLVVCALLANSLHARQRAASA